MSWYGAAKRILESEPETWLAYLYGQKLEEMPAFLMHPPRFKGAALRVLAFFAFMAKQTSWRRKPVANRAKVDYLVFASSVNQMNALDGTVRAILQNNNSLLAISKKKFINTPERRRLYSADCFSAGDMLRATILFIVRAPSLYLRLRDQHPAKRHWYFHNFCHSYPYLMYFFGLFREVKPGYVIVSNDHTCANRCCLAVAHYLGIATVYMQHASVSDIFPALRVNFAFLDGRSALETYRRCETNQPSGVRDVPTPLVILSGQKKRLSPPNKICTGPRFVGIALNLLDEIDAGLQLIEVLAGKGYKLGVRWHPGQKPSEIRKIRARASRWDSVRLSDPKTESPGEFLARLKLIIAGNTSILLEAAVVGVLPVYYELQRPQFSDYYGFVRSGVALYAKTYEELENLLTEYSSEVGPELEAVRYYSATYKTVWDGREGELVVRCLEAIKAGENLRELAPAVESL